MFSWCHKPPNNIQSRAHFDIVGFNSRKYLDQLSIDLVLWVLGGEYKKQHLQSFLFQNYILLIMLLHLSQFFPLSPPPPSTPHSLRQSPHHCSCPWVMHIISLATLFPILHFTSPWLFCNYLFVLLNPLTSSPIPSHPLPSGSNHSTLCNHDSVSVLLVCLVCFLDLIVDRYVFIAISLSIVLIFFFLNKSL